MYEGGTSGSWVEVEGMDEVNERTERADDPDGEDIDMAVYLRKRALWGSSSGEPHIILQNTKPVLAVGYAVRVGRGMCQRGTAATWSSGTQGVDGREQAAELGRKDTGGEQSANDTARLTTAQPW